MSKDAISQLELPIGPRRDPTLHEALAAAGLTSRPADNGRRDILRDGRVLFTGRAHEVWAWLAADQLPW